MSTRRRAPGLWLLVFVLVAAAACGTEDAEPDAAGTPAPSDPMPTAASPEAGAQDEVAVTGDVVLASDVADQPLEPQDGGEVWFLAPQELARERDAAVAQLSIDGQGRFAGAVPAGTWRPCVVQPGRQAACSEVTLDLAEGAVILLELGDGYVAAELIEE